MISAMRGYALSRRGRHRPSGDFTAFDIGNDSIRDFVMAYYRRDNKWRKAESRMHVK